MKKLWCQVCGDWTDHNTEGHELAQVKCLPCDAPTPESLNALAAWFDSPKNPRVFVEKLGKTPGYLLRQISAALEKEKA